MSQTIGIYGANQDKAWVERAQRGFTIRARSRGRVKWSLLTFSFPCILIAVFGAHVETNYIAAELI